MKKKTLMVVGIVFALSFLLLTYKTINANECRIVRLSGGTTYSKQKVHIEPETLLIQEGGCVVWYNGSKAGDITIKFEKVVDTSIRGMVCPVGFKHGKKQSCATTISPGKTSSLTFNKEGEFKYYVEAGPDVHQECRIIVTKYSIE